MLQHVDKLFADDQCDVSGCKNRGKFQIPLLGANYRICLSCAQELLHDLRNEFWPSYKNRKRKNHAKHENAD